MLPSIVCEIIRRINKGTKKKGPDKPLPLCFALLFRCALQFALLDHGKNDSQSGKHAGRDDIETHCEWICIIYTEQAARSGYKEAPTAGRERKCIILHKAILGIEFVSGFAKRDICGEYPQVTHGHAD